MTWKGWGVGGRGGQEGDLKPARPELVVGYTFHRLLVAQFGTMVTPNPSPIATQRMNRLRLVKGSIEMTCATHDASKTLARTASYIQERVPHRVYTYICPTIGFHMTNILSAHDALHEHHNTVHSDQICRHYTCPSTWHPLTLGDKYSVGNNTSK